MSVAQQLKALRLSLPGRPGVRKVARAMGKPGTPNAYGYYESAEFTRAELPLSAAREIALAFEELGGSRRDVLRLAGIVEGEAAGVPATPPVTVFIQGAIALPSEGAIVSMIAGLLRSVGLDEEADEHAETLARRFPDAFAQASRPLQPRETGDRPQLEERRTPRAQPARDTSR